MVFSQTSLNTRTVLKVVELDRLKTEKKNYVNGLTGVITDGYSSNAAPSSPVATTSSFAEVYLKPEPLFESAMLDYEFFQDLVPLSSAPAKEEVVQTIDSSKKTEETAHKIDTPYTPFSPQGWENLDVNSQFPQATGGLYNNISPHEPLSPNEKFPQYDISMPAFPDWDKDMQFKKSFLDISKLPVVIGDLASEMVADTNPWQVQDPVELTNTHENQYYHMYTNPPQNPTPFIDTEDSLDLKFGSVIPREVESNNVVISEFIINEDQHQLGMMEAPAMPRREGLSVDVSARAPGWPYDTISTPEVLSYVEQLEKEKSSQLLKPPEYWPVQDASLSTSKETFTDLSFSTSKETFTEVDTPPPAPVDYDPITPKSESHLESDNDDVKSTVSKRRRPDTDESDETYTPYSEQPSRKYRKRKPSVPIKDMILALEGQPKARRGRPPKRRESTVSSVCSVDDNSSNISTQEFKYRELRDKNNEASKRSRMNRKLKELQMEQLADELEEKNKKLRVRADILEEMTKRLKNELMSAILKSK